MTFLSLKRKLFPLEAFYLSVFFCKLQLIVKLNYWSVNVRFLKQHYSFFAFLFLFLVSKNELAQQSFILYGEDFNSGGPTFQINTAGVGSNSGTNNWIINDIYNGQGNYPNTIDQNNTTSGTITSAPFSKYLHIHDVNSVTGGENANYDPNAVSDRFAIMKTGICTKSLKDVKLTFFNIINASGASFGQLYYSINNGAWIQIGGNYQNSNGANPLWKYEIVTDPAFENVQDLRFGWRWQNDNTTPPANSSSWGIDDVQIVGTYDDVNDPVSITVTNLPASVCRGTNLFAGIQLSDTLCDGSYSIQLSNAAGSFANPTTWSTSIFYPSTTGFIYINIPNSIPAGTCYKIRVNRLSPLPQISGDTTICFEIKDCPNTITTLQPAVTLDTCDVCVNSVIDVPFWSTGVFTTGNVYTAQLSDTNGNFTTPFILGNFPSTKSFDPTVVPSPGTVSGLIPSNVPPGCNYYVRVVSSNPNTIGTVWGPFCIRHCDIETNNKQDIQVCVTPTQGGVFNVPIDINVWNALTNYGANNQFQVEVLDAGSLAQVNLGGLGVTVSSTSSSLTLTVPNLSGLGALGLLPPKMWYIRIFPTNANPQNCTLGTLVRLVIGSVDPDPLIIMPSDTLFCKGEIGYFYVQSANSASKYQWFLNNSPFPAPNDPRMTLGIIFNTIGTFTLNVQETNNGCIGPMSPPITVNVIGTPSAFITGPSPVCAGDTITYQVPFTVGTHFEWSILNNLGTIVDTGNNVVRVVFNTPGVIKLNTSAFNMCGSKNGFKNITVKPQPTVSLGPDSAICENDSIMLKANLGAGINNYWWVSNGSTIATMKDSIKVSPSLDSTAYIIHVKDVNNCKNSDTLIVSINPLPEVDLGPDQIICIGNAAALSAGGSDTYYWSPATGLSSVIIANPIATPTVSTTYNLKQTSSFGCENNDSIAVKVIAPTAHSNEPQSVCEGEAVVLKTEMEGITYLWSNDEITQSIQVSESGTYILTMTNPSDNCQVTDTFKLVFADCDIYVFAPTAFTPNGDGLNDVFYVYPVGINQFKLDIFNRWGDLIFHSDSPAIGWDGKANTGSNIAQEDVYVWRIHISGILSGEEQSKTYIGRVALIR